MTEASAAAPVLDDDTETETYVDFRPTGGLHVVVDGVKRRLRTPRMRDYRHLYELWREEAERLEEASEELQVFLTELLAVGDEREKAGQPRITEAERARDRELGRKVRVATEEAALRWWVETIRTLGVNDADRRLDDDDPAGDLPVFMAGAESVNQALNHWRSVPSRSGAR